MKKLILIVAVVSWSANTSAQVQWEVDSSHVAFYIDNAGFEVEGSFSDLSAEIAFSPNRLEKSKMIASVPANTVRTGIKLRDKHLKKYDYFDVENFPNIELQSEIFERKGENYIGEFELMLKGKSTKLTIPFVFEQDKKAALIEGGFSINRLDFDLGKNSIILSDTVRVEVMVKLSKK